MRFKGLDLNLLVALEVLLREQNVTNAATKLNLTQSATSNALARLREQFGDQLLIKSGRELRRSARAEAILPKLHGLLTRLEADLMHPQDADPRNSDRRIRIMASDYVSLVSLGAGLAEISREAPRLKFDIVPINDEPSLEVETYGVDLLITPEIFTSSRHPASEFFVDSYVVLTCASNSHINDDMSVDQYLNCRHLVVRFQRGGKPTYDDRHLEQQGHHKESTIAIPSHALVPHFLLGTQMIATVQLKQARIFAEKFPLKIVRLPIDVPDIKEMFQWHVANDDDAVLAYVRTRLVEFESGLSQTVERVKAAR